MTDLVARAAGGDRAAFELIYHEQAGQVYALCLRLAGDAVKARDYTQDVFIRAWRELGSFRGEAALSSWLHRITVNVVLQDRRAEGRRLRRVETREELPAVARGDHLGLRMDLEAAIARLPRGAREVFVLHDVEGYEHAEVAAALRIAVGTSKAHLHRARRLLREALER
jgi:RNA polymerase sigma-70 factor (ECF subfamily)